MVEEIPTTSQPLSQPESSQPDVVVIPPPPQKNPWKTLFLALLGLALVGGGIFAGYWYFIKGSEQVEESVAEEEATPSSTTASPFSQMIPSPPVEEPEINSASETVSVDSEWNRYINRRLGFSIKVPKEVSGSGPCDWSEKDGDHSYRPGNATMIPVKIFEDGHDVYISTEYFYQLTGETREGNRSYYSSCPRVTNSLTLLKDPDNRYWGVIWKLTSQEVASDAELEAFLQEEYGSGCALGAKTATAQSGVYDVAVLGDGKTPPESTCFLNYALAAKYSPGKGRAATWALGQSYTFWKDMTAGESYDDEMADSFRFE